MDKIRTIITGTTGMVGEGVLHECLLSADVEAVLVVNRKPCGVVHPKLKEIIHSNFLDLSSIEEALRPYNACFFCLGVSSIGLKEPAYHQLTYELTLHLAQTVLRLNPGMTFCYVSGSGTDSTEKGRRMWARVKGKTENHLLQMAFKRAYMFRPGYMQPTTGLRNTLKSYKVLGWLYPLWRSLFPNFVCTLHEVGQAMIKSVNKNYPASILEVKDIVMLSNA